MSVQLFKSLLFKSMRIQREIDREHQRRLPDWMRLLKLKKLRLAIKDRIERLAYHGSNAALRRQLAHARTHKRSHLKIIKST